MDKPILKPGDPCPCCGQPIKTTDPKFLALLTYISERGVNQQAFLDFLIDMDAGGANDDTVMQ